LLYDHQEDPLQRMNLVESPAHAGLVSSLDRRLTDRLRAVGDEFLPGPDIIRREGYALNERGDIAIES